MGNNSLNEKFKNIRERSESIHSNARIVINNAEILANESFRVANVAGHAPEILEELNAEFERQTGLTKTDIVFLFSAIGLQIARQYLLTNFKKRLGDQEAAEKISKDKKHSNRHHQYYNPSLKEIKNNPVPFDALNGANGALRGGGIFKHRGATLGHDPVLGLIFGTANIATSTLTTNKLQSYHITTQNKKDFFRNKASTVKVFEKVGEKLLHQGFEGWEKIGLSIILEIKHLLTDVNSKDSLPLPFLTLIDGLLDTSIASDLAQYGFDMANIITVGEQAALSIFINSMVAMLHRMLYNDDTEKEQELYEVRTRKILKYSNAVAVSSNIAVVALTKRVDYIDIGGIGVAIYRLITDEKFIREVKHEFIYGSFKKIIQGDELKLEDINI